MRIAFKYFSYALIFTLVATATGCKNKNKSVPTVDTTTTIIQETAPVMISSDEELRKGVVDATKDYPGVEAMVSNGEVTLSGKIKRDRLAGLMQAVNALQPKKVNNNLVIED